MKPRKADEAFEWDMREAALEAMSVLEGRSAEEFLRDGIRIRAIERLIEIIGEAASRVSKEGRHRLSQIPWDKVIGQRHVLAHDYGQIDPKRLYDVVAVHLPPLIRELDGIGLDPSVVRPEPEDEGPC